MIEQAYDLFWQAFVPVQAALVAVWSAVWIPVAIAAQAVARSDRPSLWLARRIWAPGVLALMGARLRVVGRERLAGLEAGRGALFVANHRSWADVPALLAGVPRSLRFLAKTELARVPFLGWYIEATGMVFVDRSARRRAVATVDRTADLLAAGAAVLSFPEGTRSRDGRLRPFKTGTFHAALESGAPVVPVAISGSEKVVPPGRFLARPGRITVRFGEPLAVAPFQPKHDRAGLAAAAHAAVAALLAEAPG